MWWLVRLAILHLQQPNDIQELLFTCGSANTQRSRQGHLDQQSISDPEIERVSVAVFLNGLCRVEPGATRLVWQFAGDLDARANVCFRCSELEILVARENG